MNFNSEQLERLDLEHRMMRAEAESSYVFYMNDLVIKLLEDIKVLKDELKTASDQP